MNQILSKLVLTIGLMSAFVATDLMVAAACPDTAPNGALCNVQATNCNAPVLSPVDDPPAATTSDYGDDGPGPVDNPPKKKKKKKKGTDPDPPADPPKPKKKRTCSGTGQDLQNGLFGTRYAQGQQAVTGNSGSQAECTVSYPCVLTGKQCSPNIVAGDPNDPDSPEPDNRTGSTNMPIMVTGPACNTPYVPPQRQTQ